MSPNVKLKTIIATLTEFRVEDALDTRFYLHATLGSGVLRFEVVARLPGGKRGSASGKELFGAMMAHFAGRINIIEGNWANTVGMTANLDQVNRATAAGLDIEDAAALTWTGLRASEYGFDQVWIALKSGRPGSYDYVQAQFSR